MSAHSGLGYDIESIDADGKLLCIEVKGRVDGEKAKPPDDVSGVDSGLPGFWDTQITRNLQQLLAAGRTSH
ncbi:MAG: protein NO VEIN domain-containing protein [Sphaerospermopsis kisseleviana]